MTDPFVLLQKWWSEQSDKFLVTEMQKCLETRYALDSQTIPLHVRRMVHFDMELRRWLRGLPHNAPKNLRLLPLLEIEKIDTNIPLILQHTLNRAIRELFMKGKEWCSSIVAKRTEDFQKLQDRIETSQTHVTDQDLETKAREHLPTGTNAVATKKYIDWIEQDVEKRLPVKNRHSRQFWLNEKNQLLWSAIWKNPLSVQVQVPPDLRVQLLTAKLQGALEIFPTSGCYVAPWSLVNEPRKENRQTWDLGVYTLFPRHAHERLFTWKGEVSSIPLSSDNSWEQTRMSLYRQSYPFNQTTYYIDVIDNKGREMGFNREDEWIGAMINEPPPSRNNNTMTVLEPAEQEGKHPSVELYTCQEVNANSELFLNYYTKGDKLEYSIGQSFEDSRRRMHFFLAGKQLREWIKKHPDNQSFLAEFIQTRAYQYAFDDFYWRQFQAPSPHSHVFLK